MTPIVMVIGILLFVLVAGAGVALVVGRGNKNVDDRLEQFVGTTTVVEIPEDARSSQSGPDMADRLDKALSGRSFFDPTKQKIAKSDVKLRVSEYYAAVVIFALIGGAAGYFLPREDSAVIGVIGLLIGAKFPGFYIGFAANKRMRTFDNQLSDTLNLWVNALRSGYSVLQGMEAIATELPPPVSVEFERVVQEVRLGLSVEQALFNMYRRVPSEDLDLVITAVNIQREVGGNLAEVLDNISFTIRERVRIKGEIRTMTAQGRASGVIISLLPVGLGMILYMINPEYVSQLWIKEEPWIWPGVIPCGYILIGVGFSMIAAGAFAIRKIVDIEV
jgi:tight adherence protein B